MKLLTASLLLLPTFAEKLRGNETAPFLPSRDFRQLKDDRYDLCPIARKPTPTKYIVNPVGVQFVETSYLANSQQTFNDHPVAWVGSDGSWDFISAVDLVTGNIIQTFHLDVDVNPDYDWEAISLGPCTSKCERTCLYIGAVGNNLARDCRDRSCKLGLSEVAVFKLEEPDVNVEAKSRLSVATLRLNYFNQSFPTKRADAEAMFVDQTGDEKDGERGDVYIITKFPGNAHLQRLAKIPVAKHENLGPKGDVVFSLLPVGKPYGNNVYSAADMSVRGRIIAMHGPSRVKFFPRLTSETVAEALENENCPFSSESKIGGFEQRFEAVAMIGRRHVAEASECYGRVPCPVAVSVYKLRYGKTRRRRLA